jgi:hypothetical protein
VPGAACHPRHVAIEGVKSVDIQSNPTLRPIEGAPAPQRSHNYKSHTEPEAKRSRKTEVGVECGYIERWIVRIRPGTVSASWIVGRRIHEFGIGWLYDDALAFGRHPLLGVGPECSRGCSLVPETLDRIHDVRLLRHDGITQLFGPVEFLAHHPQDLGKRHQGLDAGVPRLGVDGFGQLVFSEIGMTGVLQTNDPL